MAIPRPKILTAIVIPAGGWVWKIYLTNVTQYDLAVTATMAAGTYFMAGDNQADDFLYELALKMNTAIDAGALAAIEVLFDIHPTTRKVRIKFSDATGANNDVKLAWTENDGDDIGKVLGFNHASDDTSTVDDDPVFTADWQHAYGWYALSFGESASDDGWLKQLEVVDLTEITAMQARSLSGKVKTQRISANLYSNVLDLQFVTRTRMFSDGVAYATDLTYPLLRNQGLECWWQEARNGTHFRVYRDADYSSLARASESGIQTARTGTTLTDSGKSWDIDGVQMRHKGRILYFDAWSTDGTDIGQGFYISSHSATVLTVPLAPPGAPDLDFDATKYYILDHTYGTYVVDLDKMGKFGWTEHQAIDRYDISISLLRYVS